MHRRINHLLDSGSPFLEFFTFAAHEVCDEEITAAGIIAGTGRVEEARYMIVGNDATAKGGTYYPLTVKKHLRAQAIVLEGRLPCIYLVDSGGTNPPRQDEMFPDREHFDRVFFNQANMSACGAPQVAVVMGSYTAGGAYMPAMSNGTVIVCEQVITLLAGPPLVKVVTGEVISTKGPSSTDVYYKVSGVADHCAEDNDHILAIACRYVANLDWRE